MPLGSLNENHNLVIKVVIQYSILPCEILCCMVRLLKSINLALGKNDN